MSGGGGWWVGVGESGRECKKCVGGGGGGRGGGGGEGGGGGGGGGGAFSKVLRKPLCFFTKLVKLLISTSFVGLLCHTVYSSLRLQH